MKQFFGLFYIRNRASPNVRIIIRIDLILIIDLAGLGRFELIDEGLSIAAKKPGEHHRETLNQALNSVKCLLIFKPQNLFRRGKVDIDRQLRITLDL